MAYLHEVFQLSGTPSVTFVEPSKFSDILVSVRTPGRCLVLEGPSGIGKSTTIQKILDKEGIKDKCMTLTPRNPGDVDIIAALPELKDIGTVILDDFHRLPIEIKTRIADFMKVLADTDSKTSKLILIGINKAGQQLVKYAHDLGLRIDVFKLESNSDEKVVELLSLGEKALNIEFADKGAIAARAEGSFQICQLLAHKLCTVSRVIETQVEKRNINISVDGVVEEVMTDLNRIFKEPVIMFARGSKLRKEGRAPYLHILRWLATEEDWSLDLGDIVSRYPQHKQSIGQVIDKGHLHGLLKDPEKEAILSPYFYFEQSTAVLSVEDPRLVFYLKNLVWRAFTRQVGYKSDYFQGKYDFALSFAGLEREHAKMLHQILTDREVACFYDLDEQHRILASNVEEYLAPIYRSEARYVVPLLSQNYPGRIWTKFESDQFRERFGQGTVIPIRYIDTKPGWYSEEHIHGALSFDPAGDVKAQMVEIADTLCKRLIEDRQAASVAAAEEDKLD